MDQRPGVVFEAPLHPWTSVGPDFDPAASIDRAVESILSQPENGKPEHTP